WNTTLEILNQVVVDEESTHKLFRTRPPLKLVCFLSVMNRNNLYKTTENNFEDLKISLLIHEIVRMRLINTVRPLVEGHLCFLLKYKPRSFNVDDELKEKILKTKLASEKIKEIYEGLESVYRLCNRWYIPHELIRFSLSCELDTKPETIYQCLLTLPNGLDVIDRFWRMVDAVITMNSKKPIREIDLVKNYDDAK